MKGGGKPGIKRERAEVGGGDGDMRGWGRYDWCGEFLLGGRFDVSWVGIR